jgi:thiamine-monophosphate kinase
MASAEDDLIARHFRPLATAPGALGLIDDAATLNVGGDDLVVTTDAIVEGVHFLPDDPPDTIARKALRVNLSDLAAKGADPAGFVLTLALRDAGDDWLARFAGALGEDARLFSCPLLGGDTVSTPGPLMISVTAFGRVPSGRMVRRDGARTGDLLAITGTVGDAALGLDILRNGGVAGIVADDAAGRDALIGRYRVPQPRHALAAAVRDHATAAMDVSDGLAGDLAKLCSASGVSAQVEIVSVPLSPVAIKALAQGAADLETVLAGGDDYEILCTVPENRWDSFIEAARAAGVPVTAIGHIVAGSQAPDFVDGAGHPVTLKRLSYSHF